MLIKCVERSTGPILELGMGYSTMILHNLCELDKRKVYSYENDPKWYVENLIYRADYHHQILVTDWDEIDIEDKYWSVVLIDHRPAKRRRVDALRVKDWADYVILHDSEPEIDRFYGYKRIYQHFKNIHHDTRQRPYTTVLSNFKDLSTL
jgi:sensor histidine kinase YesM